MTELGGLVAKQLVNSPSGSCGVVSTNCEIKIIDPETGEILGPNQTGELCAKSSYMMTGYYKNPVATENTMGKNGEYESFELVFDKIYKINNIRRILTNNT